MQRASTMVVGILAVMLGGCSGSDDASDERETARCGDGRVDFGEECDGSDLQGRSCASFRSGGEGVLACRFDCTVDATSCHAASCGNGRIDGVTDVALGYCEQCDGVALGHRSCAGFGGTGTLRCTESCGVDSSSCDGLCGNGRLGPDEPCEFNLATGATVLPEGASCESLGLGSGSLYCYRDAYGVITPSGAAIFGRCALSTYDCALDSGERRCGDGIKQSTEACDGTDFGGLTCDQIGMTGTLRCNGECELDFSECTLPPGPGVCGNGIIETGEQCDGARIAPIADDPTGELFTCVSYASFLGIELCTDACRIDRARCPSPLLPQQCGNGVAEASEDCDGDDVRGVSCADLGGAGTVRCTPSCWLDRSQCDGIGGNGRREGDEPCDILTTTLTTQADVGDASCASLGYGSGDLGCYTQRRSYQYPDLQPADFVLLPRFATFGCTQHGFCGDGHAADGEECDGDDLGGATCGTFDAEGDLRCTGCRIDLSGCRSEGRCGDGRVSFGEQCEPGKIGASCRNDGGVGEYECDPELCYIERTGCESTCPAP